MKYRKAPVIVRSVHRRTAVIEPPPFKDHPWAPTEGVEDDRVLIENKAMEELLRHCKDQGKDGVEALGFLVGGIFSWKGSNYTLAHDAITTELEASSVSVRFDRQGFPGLFEGLDRLDYNYILVGWYHSHPDYGCFLSATDIKTQRTGFSEAHQFALVIDPVRSQLKAFRITEDEAIGIAVGIYREKEWPWPGRVRP